MRLGKTAVTDRTSTGFPCFFVFFSSTRSLGSLSIAGPPGFTIRSSSSLLRSPGDTPLRAGASPLFLLFFDFFALLPSLPHFSKWPTREGITRTSS
jgi:hypothetical protein